MDTVWHASIPHKLIYGPPLEATLGVAMDRNRVLVLTGAIAVTVVLAFSPAGSAFLQGLGLPAPASTIDDLGAAFLAMFPQATVLGHMSPASTIGVSVDFPVRNAGQLNALIESISTPGSPDYRHFLTPSQFDATYSPSEAQYLQALAYFQSYNLSVTPQSDRLILAVSGSPNAMGAAFHTSFDNFGIAGSTFYGPTSAPYIPSALGASAAFGFTSETFMRPLTTTADLVPATPVTATLPSTTAACTTGTGSSSSGYTPCQIEAVYGTSTLLAKGYTGAGEKVAIVDGYDPTETQTDLTNDLNTFSTDYALPTPSLHYVYPVPLPSTCNSTSTSGGCYDNEGWGGETVLDMDWVHGTGTGAEEDVTLSPNSGAGLYEDVNGLVSQDLPNVISLSWGEPSVNVLTEGSTGQTFLCSIECNATTDGSYATLHPVLEAAAAEGITVFVASGDCGADDGTPEPAADYPAADEYATGVGGTTLTASGTTYTSETAWAGNESSCPGNDGGAGGGWAPTPQPWYQTGTGVVNKGLRGVPDVGITVGSWLAVVQGGSKTVSAGTSDGGPQWGGLIAIADQMHGGDVGFINPALYAMLRSSSYSSYFHDITSGSNGYSAGTGWDPVTGVGTPMVQNAIPYIANNSYFPPQTTLNVSLAASTTSGAAPLTVTFTATATGGTGTYPYYDFSETGYLDGNATSSKTNSASYTYKKDGAYVAQVEVFDSSGNSSLSAPVLINVGNTVGSLAVTLTPATTTPSVGASDTFTAAATGGTTPYSYYYDFGDGAMVNGTTLTSIGHAFGSAGTYYAEVVAWDSAAPNAAAQSSLVKIVVTAPVTYSVTLVTSPTTCSITFNGVSHASGSVVTGVSAGTYPLVANTCSGEAFGSWTSTAGTVASGSSASTTVTISATGTITATYTAATTYTVSFATSPTTCTVTFNSVSYTNGGSATGVTAGSYPLVANGCTGETFSSWTSTAGTVATPTAASTTATISSSGTITATYTATTTTYTVTFATSPTACTVTFNSVSYSNGQTATGVTGGVYTLVANPCTGETFSSWGSTAGTVTSTTASSTTVTVSATGTITATYAASSYTVTFATSPTSCTIEYNGNSYTNGASTTLAAGTYSFTANTCSGETFSSWSSTAGSLSSSSSNPTSLTVSASGTLTASYTASAGTYTVTFDTAPTSCTVTFNGQTYSNGASASGVAGGTYTLAANSCTGETFGSWSSSAGSVASSTTSPTTITIDATGTVTATYSAQVTSYSVDFTVSPTACSSASTTITFNSATYTSGGSASVAAGTYDLVAGACSGYTFDDWSATASSFTLGSTTLASTTVLVSNSGTITATYTASEAKLGATVWAPASVAANSTFTLYANATGGGSPYTVSWNFGNGQTSASPSSSSTSIQETWQYAVPGTYTITATITDQTGQSATATTSITVTSAGGGTSTGANNVLGLPMFDWLLLIIILIGLICIVGLVVHHRGRMREMREDAAAAAAAYYGTSPGYGAPSGPGGNYPPARGPGPSASAPRAAPPSPKPAPASTSPPAAAAYDESFIDAAAAAAPAAAVVASGPSASAPEPAPEPEPAPVEASPEVAPPTDAPQDPEPAPTPEPEAAAPAPEAAAPVPETAPPAAAPPAASAQAICPFCVATVTAGAANCPSCGASLN